MDSAKVLVELLSSENDIKDTASLVNAFNSETDPTRRQAFRKWLTEYVSWFISQRDGDISADEIQEYKSLSCIKIQGSEDIHLMDMYFLSMDSRVCFGKKSRAQCIEALTYSLQRMDNAFLQCSVDTLQDLAVALFSQLPTDFTAKDVVETINTQAMTILTLYMILVSLRDVDAKWLTSSDSHSLYESFCTWLKWAEQAHIPIGVLYQIKIVLMGVERLAREDSESNEKEWSCGEKYLILHLFHQFCHIAAAPDSNSIEKESRRLLNVARNEIKEICWLDMLQALAGANYVSTATANESLFFEWLDVIRQHQQSTQEIDSPKMLSIGMFEQLMIRLAKDPTQSARQKDIEYLQQLTVEHLTEAVSPDIQVPAEFLVGALKTASLRGEEQVRLIEACWPKLTKGLSDVRKIQLENWLKEITVTEKSGSATVLVNEVNEDSLFSRIRPALLNWNAFERVGSTQTQDQVESTPMSEQQPRRHQGSMTSPLTMSSMPTSPRGAVLGGLPSEDDPGRSGNRLGLDSTPFTSVFAGSFYESSLSYDRFEISAPPLLDCMKQRFDTEHLQTDLSYILHPRDRQIHLDISRNRANDLAVTIVLYDAAFNIINIVSLDNNLSDCGGVVLLADEEETRTKRFLVNFDLLPWHIERIAVAAMYSTDNDPPSQLSLSLTRQNDRAGNELLCDYTTNEMDNSMMTVGQFTRQDAYWEFQALAHQTDGRATDELRSQNTIEHLRRMPSLPTRRKNIKVKVDGARDLAKQQNNANPNPYFVITYKDMPPYRSSTKSNTDQPIWPEVPVFEVPDVFAADYSMLLIQIFSDNGSSEHRFLGQERIPAYALFRLSPGEHKLCFVLEPTKDDPYRGHDGEGDLYLTINVENEEEIPPQ